MDIFNLIDEKNKQRFIKYNDYNLEKLKYDRFVSETIYTLCEEFKAHVGKFQQQETIKIVDVGPAHGAIGTCIFLMVINEFNLLDKVQLCLIDPVNEVIDDTIQLNFPLKETMNIVHKELLNKKILVNELSDNKLDDLFLDLKKIFNNAIGITEKVQDFKMGEEFETYDIIICTFCLHHIHPDHKTDALRVILDLLKPKGFFAFADEWFGENYYEYFLLGHNHFQDPIPFEFPESPEDLIDRLKKKISLIKVVYDEKEAYMISGFKRIPEDIKKTGHYPDIDYSIKF